MSSVLPLPSSKLLFRVVLQARWTAMTHSSDVFVGSIDFFSLIGLIAYPCFFTSFIGVEVGFID